MECQLSNLNLALLIYSTQAELSSFTMLALDVMFQVSIQFLGGYAEEWKLLSALVVCRLTKMIGNTLHKISP